MCNQVKELCITTIDKIEVKVNPEIKRIDSHTWTPSSLRELIINPKNTADPSGRTAARRKKINIRQIQKGLQLRIALIKEGLGFLDYSFQWDFKELWRVNRSSSSGRGSKESWLSFLGVNLLIETIQRRKNLDSQLKELYGFWVYSIFYWIISFCK